MDFSPWSPSHLIIAAITIATIIAHVTYLFSRLKATIERLCDRLDDTNHRIQSVDKRIDETNQQVAYVRQELHQLNQNHIEHLNRHDSQQGGKQNATPVPVRSDLTDKRKSRYLFLDSGFTVKKRQGIEPHRPDIFTNRSYQLQPAREELNSPWILE